MVADASLKKPRVPTATKSKVAVALALGLLVVRIVPEIGEGPGEPPIGVLLLSGFLVAVVALACLYLALVRDLSLPRATVLYTIAFHGLILFVKFVLAPRGFYDVNRSVEFESFTPIDTAMGAIGVAAIVLILYIAVYGLIYLLFKRTLAARERKKILTRRRVIIGAVVLGVTLLSSGAVLLFPLVFADAAAKYLGFVFTSGVSLVLALALVAATALAMFAFDDVADRADALSDVSLIVSFFWVGLAFLAIYHVLWVVYILVLTSIWPIKVIVPK